MDNTTLKACITKTLKNEYPNFEVYKDKQGSEVVLPAFFVRHIDVGQESAGRDFYIQCYLVEIRYRPEEDLPENELNTHLDLTGGKIADLLSTIRDGEFSARAEKIDYQIIDGILVVVATYNIRKRIVAEQNPLMAILEERQEVM